MIICKFQSLPTLIFRPSPPSWSSPAPAYALCGIMYGRWVGGGYIQERPPCMALNHTVVPCPALKCIRQYGWPPLHCILDDDPDGNVDWMMMKMTQMVLRMMMIDYNRCHRHHHPFYA